MAPTLKADRKLSNTKTRGIRGRPSSPSAPTAPPSSAFAAAAGPPAAAKADAAAAAAGAPPGTAKSSGRVTRNSSSRKPRVCCRSMGKAIVRKCRKSISKDFIFSPRPASAAQSLSLCPRKDSKQSLNTSSKAKRSTPSSASQTRSMRCASRTNRPKQATRFLRTPSKALASEAASAAAASCAAEASASSTSSTLARFAGGCSRAISPSTPPPGEASVRLLVACSPDSMARTHAARDAPRTLRSA
mmetsp:Transcript_84185/g.271493  ORF Transcript_84185/g.271493 Transcript_84185/m.271493 type:complete len:245 (+) Transcript_84185:492-1226(+)